MSKKWYGKGISGVMRGIGNSPFFAGYSRNIQLLKEECIKGQMMLIFYCELRILEVGKVRKVGVMMMEIAKVMSKGQVTIPISINACGVYSSL